MGLLRYPLKEVPLQSNSPPVAVTWSAAVSALVQRPFGALVPSIPKFQCLQPAPMPRMASTMAINMGVFQQLVKTLMLEETVIDCITRIKAFHNSPCNTRPPSSNFALQSSGSHSSRAFATGCITRIKAFHRSPCNTRDVECPLNGGTKYN